MSYYSYVGLIAKDQSKLISYLQIIDPTCEALSLVNGQIDYTQSPLTTGEYPVDTVASFTCDFRYYLSGAGSTTCHDFRRMECRKAYVQK